MITGTDVYVVLALVLVVLLGLMLLDGRRRTATGNGKPTLDQRVTQLEEDVAALQQRAAIEREVRDAMRGRGDNPFAPQPNTRIDIGTVRSDRDTHLTSGGT